MFPIRNGLKEGDVLSPLLFNFALDYAFRRAQVNKPEWFEIKRCILDIGLC
jgi:hypothetical protein